VIIVLLLGGMVGFVNGILSIRLQGQALILTLVWASRSRGSPRSSPASARSTAANVYGEVPDWLRNLAAMNGVTFGIPVPPVILIWGAVAGFLVYAFAQHPLMAAISMRSAATAARPGA